MPRDHYGMRARSLLPQATMIGNDGLITIEFAGQLGQIVERVPLTNTPIRRAPADTNLRMAMLAAMESDETCHHAYTWALAIVRGMPDAVHWFYWWLPAQTLVRATTFKPVARGVYSRANLVNLQIDLPLTD